MQVRKIKINTDRLVDYRNLRSQIFYIVNVGNVIETEFAVLNNIENYAIFPLKFR